MRKLGRLCYVIVLIALFVAMFVSKKFGHDKQKIQANITMPARQEKMLKLSSDKKSEQ